MAFSRSSGVILHPTSLPGPYGIGELGSYAYQWVDYLAGTGCALWQVLPLGPTGYGDSPYQCFSAFAGNPYLISLEALLRDGLLSDSDLAGQTYDSLDFVDYGFIYKWKLAVLDRAYEHFLAGEVSEHQQQYEAFCQDNAEWLDDFALFMALKDAHGGAPWGEWSPGLRARNPSLMTKAKKAHAGVIERHRFRQYLFFLQWGALKSYANEKGIQIIGDIPIFVALDSSDVWANPELYFLDDDGKPTVVAGVPPDYFSDTGQLWGNPLYQWPAHKASKYSWWQKRFAAVLKVVDIIRLDHFRGFAGYWAVSADAATAVQGQWVPGPGADFFIEIKAALGDLPIIAEDLGEITPDVEELRDAFNLPGMKILIFGFSDQTDNGFLPHEYTTNAVVYTGTHDNDTVRGWYDRVADYERDLARRYLARDGNDIAWDMIRLGWGSVAVFSLTSMQDLLSRGNEARMNYPGKPSGNWTWRVREDAWTEGLQMRLREMNFLYGRLNPVLFPPPKKVDKS